MSSDGSTCVRRLRLSRKPRSIESKGHPVPHSPWIRVLGRENASVVEQQFSSTRFACSCFVGSCVSDLLVGDCVAVSLQTCERFAGQLCCDDVSRSLSRDVRQRAKHIVESGQGDRGDQKGPLESCAFLTPSSHLHRPEAARVWDAAELVQSEIGKRKLRAPRHFVRHHHRPL